MVGLRAAFAMSPTLTSVRWGAKEGLSAAILGLGRDMKYLSTNASFAMKWSFVSSSIHRCHVPYYQNVNIALGGGVLGTLLNHIYGPAGLGITCVDVDASVINIAKKVRIPVCRIWLCICIFQFVCFNQGVWAVKFLDSF